MVSWILILVLQLISKNFIPKDFASSSPCALVITLSSLSILFPNKNKLMSYSLFLLEFSFTSFNQLLTSSNEPLSQTSYNNKTPSAFL